VESICNVLVGYFVALASQVAIFPMFGVHLPLKDNAIIGLWFTAISIARSYALRRVFNRRVANQPRKDHEPSVHAR